MQIFRTPDYVAKRQPKSVANSADIPMGSPPRWIWLEPRNGPYHRVEYGEKGIWA